MQLKRRQYYYCFATLLQQPKHWRGGVFDDKIRKIHQFVVVCTWCVTPVCSYFTKKIICRHQKYIFCCICVHRSGLRYHRPQRARKVGSYSWPIIKSILQSSQVKCSEVVKLKCSFKFKVIFLGRKFPGVD